MATLKRLAALLLVWTFAALAAPGFPPAQDLRREASGGAVLVLFSLPGCRYCDEVRALHLRPLLRDPQLRDRVAIREVDLSSDAPIVDFTGERTTHRAFARRHGAGREQRRQAKEREERQQQADARLTETEAIEKQDKGRAEERKLSEDGIRRRGQVSPGQLADFLGCGGFVGG